MVTLLDSSQCNSLTTESWYFIYEHLPFFRFWLASFEHLEMMDFLNLSNLEKATLLNKYTNLHVEHVVS